MASLQGLVSASKMQSNLLAGDPLSLDRIRSVLTRLEDTIIFSLIERAQFAHNPRMYQRGSFEELKKLGFEGSWLDWFLKETETFQAKARRYTSPDEYPFTTNLPDPVLNAPAFPATLYPNDINANPSILSFYACNIVPRITRRPTLTLAALKRSQGIFGDEEFDDASNYGSAAIVDIEVLQSISKRVHYGKFVSEAKFLEDPQAFVPHIKSRNRKALEDLITKPEVEAKLLIRLQKKAATYAQNFAADGNPNGTPDKLDVDGVVELYESFIIPITKEIEVDYLLQRLNGLTDEQVEKLAPVQK